MDTGAALMFEHTLSCIAANGLPAAAITDVMFILIITYSKVTKTLPKTVWKCFRLFQNSFVIYT